MLRLRTLPARSRDAIREFFTLASARAEIERVGPDASSEIAKTLTLSDQRAAAAEALHWQGHRVEALRLAKDALEIAAEACAAYVGARHESPVTAARALDLRGVPLPIVESVDAEIESVRKLVIPTLESDAGIEADESYARIREARDTIADALAIPASSSKVLGRRRLLRVLGALAFASVALVVGRYVTHRPPHLTATASAFLTNTPTFAPEMAVDGNDATYWLLPDHSPGYIDVRLGAPQRVEKLVLLNSTNPPYNDRGTRDYSVAVYANGRVAKRFDGHFDWSDAPEPVEHAIGVDHVDHIRIEIRSEHRLGAGLAEITVE